MCGNRRTRSKASNQRATGCRIAKAFDRLAAYEDTGLEPEEIIELKARMEGLEK